MATDPELEEEQRFLDRAHRGLDVMRGDANRMLESVLDLGRGGTFQSRTERDIVVRTSLARLAQLDIGDQAICFGRIDQQPEDGQLEGESFHIGRLAVSGPDHEPLVVDWRAPVAEPFYRATGLDPQGLARRRHLAVRGRTVVGIEDEYFARAGGGPGGPTPTGAPAPAGPGGLATEGLVLGGPGALLAALGQVRTGHMGDIVATIQREQDEIVRSPLAGVLMVQGGPGTGKTAVALHRAAYLLYTHRFPLERQGVLVVGPNPLFLRYIEQVLPSLGETGVTLSTVGGLVPEIRVRGKDTAAVARLKGEARMTRVIAQAVATRERALRRDLVLPFGPVVLRLGTRSSAEIVGTARRRPGTHNARRRFVEQQVVARLSDQYTSRLGGPGPSEAAGGSGPSEAAGGPDPSEAAGGSGPSDEASDLAELRRRIRRAPEVVEALDRMWPRLAPHELVHDLLGARPLLAAAGKGILAPDELDSLYRPRSASLGEAPFTVADAALVDEARQLLGPRVARRARPRDQANERARARAEAGFWPSGLDTSPLPAASTPVPEGEEIRSYGHIVVDEVQDLSPMQLRMLARRSLSGSMTVVGDIAQATGPWAPEDWHEVARHLSPNRPARRVELTVSYRTPAEVVELAARVLAEAAPGLTPPRPVRRSGWPPVVVATSSSLLTEVVAELAEDEMTAVAPGRTAVLASTSLLPGLVRALHDRGLAAVDPRDVRGAGLAAPLVVLPADEVNGLEFDSVVVVEPALVAAEDLTDRGEVPPTATTRGLRVLYVAMTRPTRRLVLVHSLPLPAALATDPPGELL
ncbi:MAG TPA: UvrD-helicase domain-containing protein [Acidimicrobiales bacterium]|nr:UvrD-helicase domain-containing protein [Acidimicrobiales bacterium]